MERRVEGENGRREKGEGRGEEGFTKPPFQNPGYAYAWFDCMTEFLNHIFCTKIPNGRISKILFIQRFSLPKV
jgi:hypothetical protein